MALCQVMRCCLLQQCSPPQYSRTTGHNQQGYRGSSQEMLTVSCCTLTLLRAPCLQYLVSTVKEREIWWIPVVSSKWVGGGGGGGQIVYPHRYRTYHWGNSLHTHMYLQPNDIHCQSLYVHRSMLFYVMVCVFPRNTYIYIYIYISVVY